MGKWCNLGELAGFNNRVLGHGTAGGGDGRIYVLHILAELNPQAADNVDAVMSAKTWHR
jgi:hypothetical protein